MVKWQKEIGICTGVIRGKIRGRCDINVKWCEYKYQQDVSMNINIDNIYLCRDLKDK